jgi:hypothetical protein
MNSEKGGRASSDKMQGFINMFSDVLRREGIYVDGFSVPESGVDYSTGKVCLHGCEANIKYFWTQTLFVIEESPRTICLRTGQWVENTGDSHSQTSETEKKANNGNFDNPIELAGFVIKYCEKMIEGLSEQSDDLAEFENSVTSLLSRNKIQVNDFILVQPIECCCTVDYNGSQVDISFVVGACVYFEICASVDMIVRKYDTVDHKLIRNLQTRLTVSFFANKNSLEPLVEYIVKYCEKDVDGVVEYDSGLTVHGDIFEKICQFLQQNGYSVYNRVEAGHEKTLFTCMIEFFEVEVDVEFDEGRREFCVCMSSHYVRLITEMKIGETLDAYEERMKGCIEKSKKCFNVNEHNLGRLLEQVRGYCNQLSSDLISFARPVKYEKFDEKLLELFSGKNIDVSQCRISGIYCFCQIRCLDVEMKITLVMSKCVLVVMYMSVPYIKTNSTETLSDEDIRQIQLKSRQSFCTTRDPDNSMIDNIENYCTILEAKQLNNQRARQASEKDKVESSNSSIQLAYNAIMGDLNSKLDRGGIRVENLSLDGNRVVGLVAYSGYKVNISLEMRQPVMKFCLCMTTEYVREYIKSKTPEMKDLSEDQCLLLVKSSERFEFVTRSQFRNIVNLVKEYCSKLVMELRTQTDLNTIKLPGLSFADCKKRDLNTLLTKMEMLVDWAEKCREMGYLSPEILAELRKWFTALQHMIQPNR